MLAEIVDFFEAILAQAVATCGDFTVRPRAAVLGRVAGSVECEGVSPARALIGHGYLTCPRAYYRREIGGRNGRKPRRAW